MSMGADRQITSEPGYTLLEVVIASAILSGMMAVLYMVLMTTTQLANTGQSDVDIQEYARRALEKMTDELQQAGRVTINGKQYPRFGNFSNLPSKKKSATHTKYCPVGPGDPNPGCGVPPAYSNNFKHLGLPNHLSSNPNFTDASREIIFVRPATNLPPGTPPYDIKTASILWDPLNPKNPNPNQPNEVSYLVNAGPDGINQLERRTAAGDVQVLARYVERLVVDDIGGMPDLDGSPSITRSNQIRVTLYMAKPTQDGGTVLETQLSGVVTMRN